MKQRGTWKRIILLAVAAVWMFCMSAAADELSGDNSLYSLGLENGQCSPEFYYSTLEYNVTVPAGTTELQLNPVTSDANANIIAIEGTQLDENGNGTVYITVEAPNGAQVSYVLNVTSDGESQAAATETEAQTEDTAAKESEEAARQAESEAAARLEAAQKENETKIANLNATNEELTQRIDLLMKVLYGLVAFAVILLFFIINQSLRNKDLKDDLKEARSESNMNNEFTRKERSMPNGYYYTAGPDRAPNMMNAAGVQRMDAAGSTQAAFGNASQRLSAQPMPGQAYAPVPEQPVTKKEQKKLDKAAKKAEKAAPKKAVRQPEANAAPAQQVNPAANAAPEQQAGPANAAPARKQPGAAAKTAPARKAGTAAKTAPAQQAKPAPAPQPKDPEQEKMQKMLDIPVQATMEEPDVTLDLIDL